MTEPTINPYLHQWKVALAVAGGGLRECHHCLHKIYPWTVRCPYCGKPC